MTATLVEKAFKTALRTCDCADGALPIWWNDGNFKAFLENKMACGPLAWTIESETERRKKIGCNTEIRGTYRIRIYVMPGTGRGASRDAADCFICCLSAASPVRVTDDDDAELGLKLHFSDNLQKPFVRRRFLDNHGRAVTEIGVPYTAITCTC